MIQNQKLIVFGGPLQDPGQTRSIGSMIVLDVEQHAEVEAFLRDEPYACADLFERVEIHPMRVMLPEGRPNLLLDELAKEKAANDPG